MTDIGTKTNYAGLTPVQRELLDAAERATVHSYSRYSGFRVGAALRTKEGKIFTGTNIENAAYPLTMCAERIAIFKAVSEGYRDYDSLAIIGFNTPNPVAPCGSCRQVNSEFAQLADHDIELIMSSSSKENIVVSSLDTLLPMGFGPRDLGMNPENM